MQLVEVELPADEVEFVGQSMHGADPVNALYLPATHAVQLPPSGPEWPALQVQIELPPGDQESAKQPKHVDAEAPTAVEYLPGSHGVHVAIPIDAL